MSYKINSEDVTALINGLYGVETVASSNESPVAIDGPSVTATYCNDQGECVFAIECDVAIANSLGAALTMIPPGGALDAAKQGVVPENVAENLHEVLNICSSVFAGVCQSRVVLDRVYLPNDEKPAELGSAETNECLTQFHYELPKYPAGNITLYQIVN